MADPKLMRNQCCRITEWSLASSILIIKKTYYLKNLYLHATRFHSIHTKTVTHDCKLDRGPGGRKAMCLRLCLVARPLAPINTLKKETIYKLLS